MISFLWPGRGGPRLDYISPPPGEALRARQKRRLVVLGSTGSVGKSVLSVIGRHPERFEAAALAGAKNIGLLAEQARLFRPSFLAVLDREGSGRLKALLPYGYEPEILSGPAAYAALAALPEADIIVSAQSGAAGLPATLAAALSGKTIALSNKESLVIAGGLLREICRHSGASILPLDSEHFALFQCLAGRGQGLARLILTASGGPFRTLPLEELKRVTAEEALRHPNWSMGRKISVDSATMMNKCFEIIEAAHLFGAPLDRIEAVVHPQSIVHSLVLLEDRSLLAQLAAPDMRGPIASCLFWPEIPPPAIPPLDLTAASLGFEKADPERFPALTLPKRVMGGGEAGGINAVCLIMNAANEEAVELFLQGRLGFDRIVPLVSEAVSALADHPLGALPDWKAFGSAPDAALAICAELESLDLAARDFVRSRAAD